MIFSSENAFEWWYALSPIHLRNSSSSISLNILSANIGMFPSETRKPFSPSVITSFGPHLQVKETVGNPNVTKKVTVQAAAFSQSAKDAIEAAGGKAEVM